MKFFHMVASSRKNVNLISKLKIANEEMEDR